MNKLQYIPEDLHLFMCCSVEKLHEICNMSIHKFSCLIRKLVFSPENLFNPFYY